MGSAEMLEVINTKSSVREKCLQNCEQQNLLPTVTTSVFPVQETFIQNPYFCLTLFKLARICKDPHKAHIFENGRGQAEIACQDILNANNTMTMCSSNGQPNASHISTNIKVSDYVIKYASNNLAVLKAIIKDPYYTLIKRDEKSPLIEFLGNTGGLLGLCMGLSLVSIFEICFHFINFVIIKCLNLRSHFLIY